MIHRLALCSRCLQYSEDCECCQECGGADVHVHGCTLRSSAPPPRCSTIRGLSPRIGDTKVSPRPSIVVRVDDGATGDGHTVVLRLVRRAS